MKYNIYSQRMSKGETKNLTPRVDNLFGTPSKEQVTKIYQGLKKKNDGKKLFGNMISDEEFDPF